MTVHPSSTVQVTSLPASTPLHVPSPPLAFARHAETRLPTASLANINNAFRPPYARTKNQHTLYCHTNLNNIFKTESPPTEPQVTPIQQNNNDSQSKTLSTTKTNPSRPLTGNERFYYDAAENRNGWGNSALCLRVKAGVPDIQKIETALKKLTLQHSGLRARTQAGAHICEQPTWILDDTQKSLPYTLDDTHDDQAWQAELNTLITRKIDSANEALIQFKLLHNPETHTCDILLGFHHALMDGLSAWHLMHTFTQLCWSRQQNDTSTDTSTDTLSNTAAPNDRQNANTPQTPEATDGFFQRDQKKLTDDVIGDHRTTMRKAGITAFFDSIKNKLSKPNPTFKQASSHAEIDTPKPIHYSRTVIPEETVTALINNARAHDTNLNGALTALAVDVSRELFKSHWPGFTPIQYVTPISLRHKMENWPVEDLGVCTATANQLRVIPSEGTHNFWKLAQTCKNNLHNAISSGMPAATFHVLEQLSAPLSPEPIAFAQMPKHFILINNLGKLTTPPTEQNIEYEAFSWATHQGDSSAIAQFYIASVGKTLSLTIQSNILSEKQVQLLSNTMQEKLHALFTKSP